METASVEILKRLKCMVERASAAVCHIPFLAYHVTVSDGFHTSKLKSRHFALSREGYIVSIAHCKYCQNTDKYVLHFALSF